MQDLLRIVSDSYKDFSAGQRKVGNLFVEQPIFLAFSSALEVGRKVNVSESTVIRWAQKLGYRGYTDFQQVVQQKLAQEQLKQSEKSTVQSAGGDQSFIKTLLDADLADMQKLKESLDEDKLLQVVEMISRAERIYVTANFLDYGLAHFFATWLNQTLIQTELMMPGEVQYFHQLSELTSKHTVIALSFPRHSKQVADTLRSAKRQGTNIIMISDSDQTPAIECADLFLLTSMNSNLGIDSYAAVHALLTSIMRFVYVKENSKVKSNLERINAVYEEKDVFY